MADSNVNIYAKEFSDNIMLLSRQENSKMMGKVMMKMNVSGEKFTQERMGVWTLTAKTQGVQDTPENDPDYSRRTATMITYTDSRIAARDDDLKTKVSISSQWVKAAAAAYGKQMDSVVFAALGGDSFSGVDGTTAVALPASQKVAATGLLTTETVIDIKEKLDAADVPENNRRVMIHPTDLNGLLKDDKATNSDYNTINALVKGEINTWLGFEFISTTAATPGTIYFFQEDAVCLGLNETPYVRIDERADKSYARQVYYELNCGATRLEEERVVELTLS